jgi:branched-chain amino acid transport system substrate-binding protein
VSFQRLRVSQTANHNRKLFDVPATCLFAWVMAAALLLAPATSRAADPLELTVLLPMTGYAAFFGVPQRQGLEGIEAYINRTGGIGGRSIKFVVKDDATNPQVDVQLATSALQTKIPVLFGPDTAGQCNAVTPLAKNGPVTLCFTSSTHPEPGGWVFGTGAESKYHAQVLFRYFKDRGFRRIALVTTTDASGQDGDRAMTQEAERDKGVQIVDRQFFNPSDVSAVAQIANSKASRPDAVVVWVTGAPFGTALRAIKDSGWNVPVFTSAANLLYAELKQYSEILPRDLYFPSQSYIVPTASTDPEVRKQIAIMTSELARLGGKPDQGTMSVWDGVMAVIAGLRKVGVDAPPDSLRDYLVNLQGWAGTNGRYDFKKYPQRGLGLESLLVAKYDNAKGVFTAASGPGGALR